MNVINIRKKHKHLLGKSDRKSLIKCCLKEWKMKTTNHCCDLSNHKRKRTLKTSIKQQRKAEILSRQFKVDLNTCKYIISQ